MEIEGYVKCGDNCIIRKLSNGEHAVLIPDDVVGGGVWDRCMYDVYLRYQVPSRNTVIISRPSCRSDCCCREE